VDRSCPDVAETFWFYSQNLSTVALLLLQRRVVVSIPRTILSSPASIQPIHGAINVRFPVTRLLITCTQITKIGHATRNWPTRDGLPRSLCTLSHPSPTFRASSPWIFHCTRRTTTHEQYVPFSPKHWRELTVALALQSLKEFYEDQRIRYLSPTELEMRVYHRLIHIRDQRERQGDVPARVLEHPVFKLTTKFRLHVQAKSAPIGKTTPLIVDYEGMQIFSELAMVLRREGSVVMIYLVACLLERLFGKETIEDIESIRGDLTIPELIGGVSDDSQLVVTPVMPEATLGNGPLGGMIPGCSGRRAPEQ
jgi:SAC3/GANP family